MSFLTAGETEVRAWTIPTNSTAQKAAGAIHSDFEKKFIRAETVNWKALIEHEQYANSTSKRRHKDRPSTWPMSPRSSDCWVAQLRQRAGQPERLLHRRDHGDLVHYAAAILQAGPPAER